MLKINKFKFIKLSFTDLASKVVQAPRGMLYNFWFVLYNSSTHIKLMPDDNKVMASVIHNGDGFKKFRYILSAQPYPTNY